MLSDFFRINLPYGIARNDNDEWMAFNREYLPLGYNNTNSKGMPGHDYLEMPIYTKYKGISEKKLLLLADKDSSLQRDENGKICRLFLYDDGTNPMNQSRKNKALWMKYFKKIETLSELKIKM